MKKRLFPLFIVIIILNSCDMASGINIINKTNEDIYIEFTLNPEVIFPENAYINNNINIKKNERYHLVSIFPEVDIFRNLGFGRTETIDHIIHAINSIFMEINVYKIINNENIILYNKNYFLDQNNIIRHDSTIPRGYTLDIIIID